MSGVLCIVHMKEFNGPNSSRAQRLKVAGGIYEQA